MLSIMVLVQRESSSDLERWWRVNPVWRAGRVSSCNQQEECGVFSNLSQLVFRAWSFRFGISGAKSNLPGELEITTYFNDG